MPVGDLICLRFGKTPASPRGPLLESQVLPSLVAEQRIPAGIPAQPLKQQRHTLQNGKHHPAHQRERNQDSDGIWDIRS